MQDHGLDGYMGFGRRAKSAVATEVAPLLPRPDRPPHDHPIFLRVCHSPWRFISQKTLLCIRSAIAVYLTAVFALSLFYEIAFAKRGKLFAFSAGNVSFAIQIAYYWISANWTMQHIMGPLIKMDEDEQAKQGWLAKTIAAFSFASKPKNKSAFSLFYTTAVTFPFVVTTFYWLILYPLGPIVDNEWIKALQFFVLININVVNSALALFEIMILSSVRKQKPLGWHIMGILAICTVYMMWAVIAFFIDGEFVYKSLDPAYAGWRTPALAYLTILSLSVTTFLAQRGLHRLREMTTAKAATDTSRA